MTGDNFTISSKPFVKNARCKCGQELYETKDEGYSVAYSRYVYFCTSCDLVYEFKLAVRPKNKVSESFIQKCRKMILG